MRTFKKNHGYLQTKTVVGGGLEVVGLGHLGSFDPGSQTKSVVGLLVVGAGVVGMITSCPSGSLGSPGHLRSHAPLQTLEVQHFLHQYPVFFS